jgi:hypothetical protein
MVHSVSTVEANLWLKVFYNSRANGAPYYGDYLPAHLWSWPSGTYLQRRLREVRENEAEHCQSRNFIGGFAGSERLRPDES